MKKSLIAAALIVFSGAAFADDPAQHARELTPADITFEDNPAFPKGAQSMLIHGDPSKPGFFIIRLKFPPNYIVPAHTHPALEIRDRPDRQHGKRHGREGGHIERQDAGRWIVANPSREPCALRLDGERGDDHPGGGHRSVRYHLCRSG